MAAMVAGAPLGQSRGFILLVADRMRVDGGRQTYKAANFCRPLYLSFKTLN